MSDIGWRELAVLHEAGHAWMITHIVQRSVTITFPSPPDDPRCEFDAENILPGEAAVVLVGGLAAELAAGVIKSVAYQNAEDDLSTIAILGWQSILDMLIQMAQELILEDPDDSPRLKPGGSNDPTSFLKLSPHRS